MHSLADLRGQTVLALHAHPDDEAIFTGVTLRRLADAGARVVLALATAGELGSSRLPLDDGETVAARRIAELELAAATLGVERLVLLGRRDSGLPGWASHNHPLALAAADHDRLARRVADLAEEEGAGTLIYDDIQGVYGHPDHRAAHSIGAGAAALTGAVGYRITVDRDRLPGEHLVHAAAASAGVSFGRAGEEITLAVTGDDRELASKRDAIMAHASQVDPGRLPADAFAAGYRTEWFHHEGSPGLLHLLADTQTMAGALG